MCVLLITRLLRGVGRWARKPVNHTSWVAVVTLADSPKSVRNCCLIEFFCGVVCVVTLPLWHFCWYRGFCHMTGSDLLLFVFIKLGIYGSHSKKMDHRDFGGQRSKVKLTIDMYGKVSIYVILLHSTVGVAPTKHDVISMLPKQYTHIKCISLQWSYLVVFIKPR